MADKAWTASSTRAGVSAKIREWKVTIDGTDNATEVLTIDPLYNVSITINHGGTDTLTIGLANDEAETIIDAETADADYAKSLCIGFTAIKISGASAASHDITVTEVEK
jgi:hypothetical protein